MVLNGHQGHKELAARFTISMERWKQDPGQSQGGVRCGAVQAG